MDRCCKIFYSFLFSFLSPLSSFFSFLFSLTGSLSLLPASSLYSSLRIFGQSGMFTNSDDSVAPMTTARSAGEGLEDSFLETRANLSHPLKPPPPISPSHHQYRSATLDLADLTSRPPSISPSSLSLCPPFTLPLSGCGFFFFFCYNLG